MSAWWHGDFLTRLSEARPLAAKEFKELQGKGFEASPLSKYDRCHIELLALCRAVTEADMDYLYRLSKSNYNHHLGYLSQLYWITFSDAFRGLRKLPNGCYRCEVCRKEVTQTEVHHWSYDNCGRKFAHLQDLGLLCRPCHLKQHPKNIA